MTYSYSDPDSRIHVWGISKKYNPIFSGSGVQAHRLYRALAGDEFQFTMLTGRFEEVAELPKSEVIEGVRVRRVPVFPPLASGIHRLDAAWNLCGDLFFAMACLLFILRQRSHVDLLHIHTGLLVVLVPCARLFRIPTVVLLTMLRSQRPTSAGRVLNRLEDWAIAQADKVVSLSKTMTRQYGAARVDTTEFVVIPQGVDLAAFRPASEEERVCLREQLQLDRDATYVVSVGAIIYRKGIDILVDAYAKASDFCPQLRLILVGRRDFSDHPEQRLREERQEYCEELEATLGRKGLLNRVKWTDNLPPEEVIPYLQAADVFCLPSRREGVPAAPLEAMACGLPIVVPWWQGTSAELFSHGEEGFVVETGDPNEYADYIVRLATDGELARQMGRLGRKRMEEAFSFVQAARRYRSLFRSLDRSSS